MEELKEKLPAHLYESIINGKNFYILSPTYVKLKANFKSLSAILTHDKTTLASITNLESSSTERILQECANLILKEKIYTASHLKTLQYLSTGCSSINSVLNGGIPLKGISEIVGYSGVGKTQFCLQLSLMTQLPNSFGGLEKSVVYICTEDVFPIKRFVQLSKIYSSKYQNINFKDNLYLEHISDVIQLQRCLFDKLPKLLRVKNIGLLVIDSIAGVFRSENLGVSYSDRSQDFIAIVRKLRQLSEKYGFAIVCVNQVTDNVQNGKTEACLGHAWGNLVTSRFNLCRIFNQQYRQFEIVFSPHLQANKSCIFYISTEGLIA